MTFLDQLKHKAATFNETADDVDQMKGASKGAAELLINDDEDKFMAELDKRQNQKSQVYQGMADKALDKEKKREAKKDLTFYDDQKAENDEEDEPIRKALYIESEEIAVMTQKQVIEFRRSNGDIKVRGVECPRPIQNWYQCGLPAPVIELLEKK